MAFKHNTGLTSDGVLQQGDYESTSGHLLDNQAEGDLIVADSSTTMTRMAAGAANTVLTSNGTTPSYNKLTTSNLTDATLVTEADAIASNDNDTTIPTSAAVKDYVDNQVSGTTLTFADDGATTGSVDLDTQQFTVAGTANEIEASASGQTITIGLPNNVTINTLTATNPIATDSGGTGQDLSASTGSMYVASGTVSAVDMTTKGHLLVGDGSGAPSTLAVGTNDQVLTADSTTATGLKWTAAGTFTTVNVAEDGKLDFTNTAPGTSGDATGIIFSFTAGATLAVGDVVYMGTGGKVLLADANATTSMPALGICTSASTDTNPVDVMIQGLMKLTGWSFTVGADIFISGTAGDVTATAPSASGDTVQKVGVAVASDTVYFNFNTTELVLA